MKNPRTIENYLRRKMRLEALLAVVQHKGELIKIVCTASYRKRVENLISHFSLTSEQAQYLLNADVGFLMDSEYEDVQKKYNQVVAYLTKHNNDTSIMSKDYTKGRWAHLAKYAVEKGLRCGGLYQGREYCHILFTENEEQKKEVIKKNLLKGVKADMLSKPHTDAHHLNSSQILCYNFFRPLIDKNGGATQELVDRLSEQGIPIEKGAKCTFEYTDNLDKMEKKREILIEGMMCTHCSGRVEKALNSVNGVKATVDLEKKTAFVTILFSSPVVLAAFTALNDEFTAVSSELSEGKRGALSD